MGILSGETWGGSTSGCESGVKTSHKEFHQVAIREEAYSNLIDDDLPFDLFQDVRAVMIVVLSAMPGYEKVRYFVRFKPEVGGATIEIAPADYQQILESLQYCAGPSEASLVGFPSSPRFPWVQVINLDHHGKTASLLLLDEQDIAALKQRVNGKFKFEFPVKKVWQYFDTLRGEGQVGRILVGQDLFEVPVNSRRYDRKIGVVGSAHADSQSFPVKWDYDKDCWVLL